MTTLNIGIVGAGFAGAAAALFLADRGHRVTLYEEAQEPQAVGAGILLQPLGLGETEGRNSSFCKRSAAGQPRAV